MVPSPTYIATSFFSIVWCRAHWLTCCIHEFTFLVVLSTFNSDDVQVVLANNSCFLFCLSQKFFNPFFCSRMWRLPIKTNPWRALERLTFTRSGSHQNGSFPSADFSWNSETVVTTTVTSASWPCVASAVVTNTSI